MVTVLRHLDRERFAPHLALVDATGTYLEQVPDDIRVTGLGGRGPMAFVRLARLIRRLRPDVVFSSVTFYNTLVLLLKPLAPAGTRFIVRENTVPRVHLPGMPYGWLRMALYGPAHRLADRVVCQSQEMVRAVADCGVPEARLVAIPNPVDMADIATLAAQPIEFSQPGRHLVAAGRLVPQKGYDLLLEAFARLCATRDDVTLHLLGEGPEADALKARAVDLKVDARVCFEGFQDNPFRFYRAADLFVQSSRYEGFPNVVLEAMACGTPAVTFDGPGGSPVVDGVNGWRIPAGDVAALAACLGTALDGKGLAPRQVMESIDRHRVAQVMARYQALFSGVPET